MVISGRCKTVVLLALFLVFDQPGISQTTSTKPEATPSQKSVNPLVLTTTVINKKGNFVTGLRRDNFQIFIDKKPATIVDFGDGDVPLSIGILFDASGSTGNPYSIKDTRASIQTWQRALQAFVEASNRSNEYFLLAFNKKPQLLTDWTSDATKLIDSLSVFPHGITALYDACYLAIDKVRQGRYSKRALILISDGQDNNSTYSLTQVREALKESDVLLYSINFEDDEISGSSLGIEGQHVLEELSLISGGMFFYKRGQVRLKASDAVSVFEIIAEELRHQYTIEAAPNVSFNDGKWHKIKIKMNAPAGGSNETRGLSARTREGFYLNRR